MKSTGGIANPRNSKSLRLGLLLVSSLSIMGASILVYARIIYEQVLNVGGTNIATSGSKGGIFTPGIIAVVVFSVFVATVSVFTFLREASKHMHQGSSAGVSPPTDSGSMLPSMEELEEFMKKKTSDENESVSPTK